MYYLQTQFLSTRDETHVIKTSTSNLVTTMRFCNYLHQIRS